LLDRGPQAETSTNVITFSYLHEVASAQVLQATVRCSNRRAVFSHCHVTAQLYFRLLAPPTRIMPRAPTSHSSHVTSLVHAILVPFTLLTHFVRVGPPLCHIQKSQLVESGSDRDKENKTREYMRCNAELGNVDAS
jgi:hypothetical protein